MHRILDGAGVDDKECGELGRAENIRVARECKTQDGL